jgi:hypothetical protein
VHTQTPPPVHVAVVLPLQLPKGHEVQPDGPEVGQPPAGQGTVPPASGAPVSGPPGAASVPASGAGAWHPPSTQVSPLGQAWLEPQPPQLLGSVSRSTHAPLHDV